MKVLAWDEFLAEGERWLPLAATVGVFDGLHIGHQVLVRNVVGRSPLMRTAVITFRENPKQTLHPKTFHGDLSTLAQKLGLIAGASVELCVLIDFSSDFGKLSGSDFLHSLRDRCGLRYITVGSDFRCGHKLDTDSAELAAICASMDVEAEIVEPVVWNGHPVSSSRIRRAILDGRVREAGLMLGRPYELEIGSGMAFFRRGSSLVLSGPVVPISPPPGDYSVIFIAGSLEVEAILEIGHREWILETAGDARPSVIRFIDKLSRE